jgi:signal transduction histidine kinase
VAAPRQVTTLGFGAATDQRLLSERQAVRLGEPGETPPAGEGGAQISGTGLPLVGHSGALRGALVALTPPGVALTVADRALLNAVAAHLATLLDEGPELDAPERLDKRDEREEFISLAAHELRSPLTTVKGYAQLLLRTARRDPAYPENVRRALGSIEQQASRMSDMVAELLDASRLRRGAFELHPRLVALDPLVQHTVEQRQATLELHELQVEVDAPGLMGLWDPTRVEQVVRDLVDNAIRYSPEGGEVTVRVMRAGDAARVSVLDQGIGVAPEERERIFGPYVRGAEAQRRNLSGLGLGLYVSRAIVERLNGRLWLDESGRAGTRFCFELPLAAGAADEPAGTTRA